MTITPVTRQEVVRDRYRPGCRLRLWPVGPKWRDDDLFFRIQLDSGEKWNFDLEWALNFDPDYRSNYPCGVNDVWLLDASMIRINRIIHLISPAETRAWLEDWLGQLLSDQDASSRRG